MDDFENPTENEIEEVDAVSAQEVNDETPANQAQETSLNNSADEPEAVQQPSRPDYYHPVSSEPVQSEPVQTRAYPNTTYHYSYVNQNQQPQGSYYVPPTQAQGTQPNAYSPYGNYGAPMNNNGNEPPKKSKAGTVLLIVLIVCIVIAGTVLALASQNKFYKNSEKGTTTTNQSEENSTQERPLDENGDDAQFVESEDVPLQDNENNYTVAGVSKYCRDSCVGITVFVNQSSGDYWFGGNASASGPVASGEGSGVIFKESNGKTYIITCAHVIADADSYSVTLDNGDEYDASLVGLDEKTDIGVICINETKLKVAKFADSSKVVVGEQVVAIGCPGGLEFLNSVSSGYISALDRPISSTIGYDNECIQTDTAINPGNSGGGLFNMQGQVVGINSSKIASTEYEGMGFAVPSKTAVDIANSLIKNGYVAGRAKLGVTYSPITSYSNADQVIAAIADKGYKGAQGAMVIESVDKSSSLADKDIQKYDMIVAVNGKVMSSTDVMTSALSKSKPGETIKLTIARIVDDEIRIMQVDCELIEEK